MGKDCGAEGRWPWGLSQPCPRTWWEEGAGAARSRTATGHWNGEDAKKVILGRQAGVPPPGHMGADRSLKRRDTGASLGTHSPSSLHTSDTWGRDGTEPGNGASTGTHHVPGKGSQRCPCHCWPWERQGGTWHGGLAARHPPIKPLPVYLCSGPFLPTAGGREARYTPSPQKTLESREKPPPP